MSATKNIDCHSRTVLSGGWSAPSGFPAFPRHSFGAAGRPLNTCGNDNRPSSFVRIGRIDTDGSFSKSDGIFRSVFFPRYFSVHPWLFFRGEAKSKTYHRLLRIGRIDTDGLFSKSDYVFQFVFFPCCFRVICGCSCFLRDSSGGCASSPSCLILPASG